jgi:NadR type nicotinamide-nucleotide adenylyltransferase
METEHFNNLVMMQENKKSIIVVTGAESTGKSVLTSHLGQVFCSPWYPEYAREYLEKTGIPYSRSDVEAIARVQIRQMAEAQTLVSRFVFFDTWLIITKVWMEVVYGDSPVWITEAIASAPVDLFLICDTDIPWIPDPLRENGGAMREKLSSLYRQNIENFGFRYETITGIGEKRFASATGIIRQFS